MKKAILAVSVGTSYDEAVRACIQPIEDALRAAYPRYEVFRAFTSRMIIRRLKSRGISVENEVEALARLAAEGYDDIVVAATHIIPGLEYERIRDAAAGRPISAPLLADESDLEWMAAQMGAIAREEKRPLLLMGHGTGHAADEIYSQLRAKLPRDVFLACADGGYTLDGLQPRLEEIPEKRIALMPLMLVAGAHAHNGLAGDGGSSWKSILERRGFDVRVRMQGLGELEAVQRRFVEKAGRAIGN